MAEKITIKQLGEWRKNPLTFEAVKYLMKNGHEISTPAVAMFNGGHRWWLKNGKIKCFGSGKNWEDQNDETGFSNEEAYEHISQISKKHAILIAFCE